MTTRQLWITLNARLRLAAWLTLLAGVGGLIVLDQASRFATQTRQEAEQVRPLLVDARSDATVLALELRTARDDLRVAMQALRRQRGEVAVDVVEVRDRLAALERQVLTGRVFWLGTSLSGFGYMHAVTAVEGTTWLHVTPIPCEAQ